MTTQSKITRSKQVRPKTTSTVTSAGSTTSVGGSVGILNSVDGRITPLVESTFTGRVGEVQATPTQYTILRRLKDIWDRLTDGTQKTQIVDSVGHSIGSHQSADGDYHLSVAITQESLIVASNSSTSNLSAGATFTGVGSSTSGYNGIKVTFKADQNCTIYIDQSSDNINWDISDSYEYNKLADNFGVNAQSVSTYFRTRVKNNSTSSSTTYLRLTSEISPVSTPLPRSLTSKGNLKSSIVGLSDDFGFEAEFTPMRDLKVCQPIRLVGTTYRSSIDTNFWTATNSGAGSAASVSNAVGTVTSGTANNGYGQIVSARVARFMFAHPLQFRGLFRIGAVSAPNNSVKLGSYSVSGSTPQNGVYFSISATGVLSVNCVSGGSVTSVSSGSFNGDVSEIAIDTNVHAYEIIYFTAGAWFFVDDVLIHKFTPTTTPLYQSLNVGIAYSSINDASGTTSRSLECWNASIMKLGRDLAVPASKYQSGTTAGVTLKSGSGNLHGICISSVVNNAAVTIYDNTAASGTVLWASGAMATNTTPFDISFHGMPFFTGLTIVIATANCDVTIIYE